MSWACMRQSFYLFLGFKEGEFNWTSYLKNCKAQAAPKSLFKTLNAVSGDMESKMCPIGLMLSEFWPEYLGGFNMLISEVQPGYNQMQAVSCCDLFVRCTIFLPSPSHWLCRERIFYFPSSLILEEKIYSTIYYIYCNTLFCCVPTVKIFVSLSSNLIISKIMSGFQQQTHVCPGIHYEALDLRHFSSFTHHFFLFGC